MYFWSIFSYLKTAPYFADHIYIIEHYSSVPWGDNYYLGNPSGGMSEHSSEKNSDLDARDQKLIPALSLNRCEPTDKLLHLSSSVESKGAKLDIFQRFLPALKFGLCPALRNKSRDSLQYENTGSPGRNGKEHMELEAEPGTLETST